MRLCGKIRQKYPCCLLDFFAGRKKGDHTCDVAARLWEEKEMGAGEGGWGCNHDLASRSRFAIDRAIPKSHVLRWIRLGAGKRGRNRHQRGYTLCSQNKKGWRTFRCEARRYARTGHLQNASQRLIPMLNVLGQHAQPLFFPPYGNRLDEGAEKDTSWRTLFCQQIRLVYPTFSQNTRSCPYLFTRVPFRVLLRTSGLPFLSNGNPSAGSAIDTQI